jgi:DNA-binding HxlR family transcriptional regulator
MDLELSALAQTMARRLRDIARVLDRLDRLEAGTGSWLSEQDEDNLAASALGMTLRTLRVAADSHNFQILRHLVEHDTSPVSKVQDMIQLDRMTLSERLNDMVQVGLIVREIDTDHVQISGAGQSIVIIITEIQAKTAQFLTDDLK